MNNKPTKQPHPGLALLRRYINKEPRTIHYDDYIKSSQWKRRADRFKADAGHRCRVCFGDGPLDAHHRTYQNLGNETDYDVTVLCRDCHKLYHDKMTGDNRPYAGELETK
jgi:5-methylcytosine-specific restriction endonuclease McrA